VHTILSIDPWELSCARKQLIYRGRLVCLYQRRHASGQKCSPLRGVGVAWNIPSRLARALPLEASTCIFLTVRMCTRNLGLNPHTGAPR
jgi:hypothetical protein